VNQTDLRAFAVLKTSGSYTTGPPHKRDKGWEGIQEKQQGRNKKEVKGKNKEWRGNRKGGEGMRGASKGEPGKGLGEAQCSRITF
jgi:hypothetical protein